MEDRSSIRSAIDPATVVTFKLLRGPFAVPHPSGTLIVSHLEDGYDLTISWIDDRTGRRETHKAKGSLRYLTRIWHLSGFTVAVETTELQPS